MKKIALRIEYDGSAFHGWQKQINVRSVQECVETALSKVANHTVTTICAGRTDAGVHALGQVIHFETIADRPIQAWKFGANVWLPNEISVHWAQEVPEDFSARFSAIARHYRYTICNQPIRPAINRHSVTWVRYPLDENLMTEATQHLIGEHDFSSFRAAECQSKTAKRCIEDLTVRREEIQIIIDIRANAFLHHMVRNIVGVLIEIGRGNQKPNWAKEVLDARDRQAAADTARPQGLCLMKVYYPEKFKL